MEEALGFGTKWNLRDLLRHKSRSWMTLFGIVGCMVLLVGGMGMKDTLDSFMDVFFDRAYNYTTKINLDTESVKNEDGSAGDPPAYELDEQMRATNIQFAILTNGRIWRLFHKNTVAMLNTFFEIDLLQILENRDTDTFKIFVNAFSAKSISFDKSGSCPNKKLLA